MVWKSIKKVYLHGDIMRHVYTKYTFYILFENILFFLFYNNVTWLGNNLYVNKNKMKITYSPFIQHLFTFFST